MSDAERFTARAEQAERLAADMTSEDHRDQLLGIAAEWRRMAQRAAAEEARSFKPQPPTKRPSAETPGD